MKTSHFAAASVIATAIVVGFVATDQLFAQATFADTRAIVEFQRAADAYAFLHRQAERRINLAHRRNPIAADDVDTAELAAAIVKERLRIADAVLFTPSVAAAFRDLAARAVRAGCDPGELQTGLWEMTHRTNSTATGTHRLPACLVQALPDLPAELEYRSGGTVLLVVDTHANLVVDILPALLAGSDP